MKLGQLIFKSRLENAIDLFQFYWDFMDILHDDKTPAMIESLSDHVWSGDNFLCLIMLYKVGQCQIEYFI